MMKFNYYLITLFAFVQLLTASLTVATTKSQPFVLTPGCEHITLPEQNITFRIGNVSLVSCGVHCLNDIRCKSIEYEQEVKRCSGTITTEFGCSNFSTNLRVHHYENQCMHDGSLNSSGLCSCYGGWIGPRCERIMKSCREGVPYDVQHGIYLVNPPLAPEPFNVYCFRNGHFAILQRTTRVPAVNFNRSWSDYKNGFGKMPHDYWLGLDKIHYLTQNGRFVFVTYVWLRNNTLYHSRQVGVKIGNESTSYKLNFSHSLGIRHNDTLGNCLDELNGQPFSTFDRDNDNDLDKNCAQSYGGGYWFNACSSCNPTGAFILPALDYLRNVSNEVFWKNNLGDLAPRKIRQSMGYMANQN